jgi:multidrug efflux pump subunit AcrB
VLKKKVFLQASQALMARLPMPYPTKSTSGIQQPLMAVIFGGLISSLCLTLIILPVIYVLLNAGKAATPPVVQTGEESAMAVV